MVSYNYRTANYYDQIMDEFLKYIVQFTIYYRNGGKVRDLKLTTDIGFVPLGKDVYKRQRLLYAHFYARYVPIIRC